MASVQKRIRNGKTSYCVRYRDPTGTQRRKVFSKKGDADRWMVENEASKQHGAWINPADGRVLFRDQAERWFATKASLRASTRWDYRKLLDAQVLPGFGTAPLADITTFAIREWQAGLMMNGLGAKRAGKALALLSQVLSSAVEEGRLVRNVAAGIKKPRVQRAEMHPLAAAQVEALADAIREPYPLLIRFAAYSGMRPAELTALRVGRVDVLRGIVRVAEGAPEVNGHLVWGGVKNHEARTIHLPRSIAQDLGRYLAGQPHGPDDLVFTAPRGGPLRWSKWIDRCFKPALRVAGLPETIKLYDLRHSCASLLIRQGASIKAVQAHLGHATASITLDTYGHLYGDELPALAERLEAARTSALEAMPSVEMWPQRGPVVAPLNKRAGQGA